MQNSKKPGKDLISELIEDSLLAFPVSSLLISLYKQYQQRGFLTKKQMQALHTKASEVPDIQPGRLATLEAIMKKMPNRIKSEKPENEPPAARKDAAIDSVLQSILAKYPQHKRVLYLKARFDEEELTATEIAEVLKFQKVLKL